MQLAFLRAHVDVARHGSEDHDDGVVFRADVNPLAVAAERLEVAALANPPEIAITAGLRV